MADKCETHEYRLENLDKKVEKLEDCQNDMKLKLEKLEASTKSAHFRLDSMEEHEDRLDKLERAPSDTIMKYFK